MPGEGPLTFARAYGEGCDPGDCSGLAIEALGAGAAGYDEAEHLALCASVVAGFLCATSSGRGSDGAGCGRRRRRNGGPGR